MEIKKQALENAIQESIDSIDSSGFFCEDRFAIYCSDKFEVQVVITCQEEDFIHKPLVSYEKANQ